MALQHATEARRADRAVVLAAVQQSGSALMYATEALRADRDVVLAAMQQSASAIRFAADEMLEDPTFATEAKTRHYLLKVTMLSGRSTVVAAGYELAYGVLVRCRERLGLADDGSTLELWHSSGERVPDDYTEVRHFPGIQPPGKISEYQLLVTR
eukprot:933198-Amphidinium_carterae.1